MSIYYHVCRKKSNWVLKYLCLITSNHTRVCVNGFRMCYRLTYDVFSLTLDRFYLKWGVHGAVVKIILKVFCIPNTVFYNWVRRSIRSQKCTVKVINHISLLNKHCCIISFHYVNVTQIWYISNVPYFYLRLI